MRRLLVTLFTLSLLAVACGSDAPDVTASDDGNTSTSASSDDMGTDDSTTDPDEPTSSDTTADPDSMAPSDSGDDADGRGDASGTRPAGGEDAYAIADLAVAITHPDHDDVSYTISCLGDTTTIVGSVDGVSADSACLALKDVEVVDRLVQGVPANQICTEQYGGADVAAITGRLAGESVGTTIDRVNGCGISDWDFLLVDILPSALGVTG
ncbi:MAG: hypothetical protein GY929_05745 [Actinomycetia bacterium]|nr:hypothetical protein [Actinomycetes bacterium]